MTNRNLLSFDEEVQQWYSIGSILAEFHKSKIKDFYKHNGIRVSTLNKKIDDMHREYFQYEALKDKDGIINLNNTKIKLSGEGKDRQPILLDGKTFENFNKDYSELLNANIDVKF